jgi:tRNA nucleotidyltransferase/poly(A) polymerase
MAYDFRDGNIIDPYGGRADCRRHIIRAVGDPRSRFEEDGLRMFRLYRLMASHNLTIERATERAVDPRWAKTISFERIRDEFSKLLLTKAVRKGLIGLIQSRLLPQIIPEFFDSNESYPEIYSYLQTHSLSATAEIQPLLHLRLAALLHDIAKPISVTTTQSGFHFYGHDHKGADLSRDILTRLRYPRKLIHKVALLIRWHMFFYQPNISDAAVRRLISKVGPENIPDLLELRRADIIATGKITTATHEYWRDLSERILAIVKTEVVNGSQNKLALNGHDLIEELGVNPGPIIGEIITRLWEEVFNDPALNRKDLLLDLARKYLDSKLQ